LNVTWNARTPASWWVVCAMIMTLNPSSHSIVPFKMASVAYLTVFLNLNPLLKYDGYYILSDVLRIPYLRERSLDLQKDFLKILRRESGHGRIIFTVFGASPSCGQPMRTRHGFLKARLSSSLQMMGSD
jgi:hypothetical protein